MRGGKRCWVVWGVFPATRIAEVGVELGLIVAIDMPVSTLQWKTVGSQHQQMSFQSRKSTPRLRHWHVRDPLDNRPLWSWRIEPHRTPSNSDRNTTMKLAPQTRMPGSSIIRSEAFDPAERTWRTMQAGGAGRTTGDCWYSRSIESISSSGRRRIASCTEHCAMKIPGWRGSCILKVSVSVRVRSESRSTLYMALGVQRSICVVAGVRKHFVL